LTHFHVGHVEVLPSRLGDGGFFVDQRLQDLLVDAELTQHLLVDLPAVRGAVLLQLGAVAALELRHGDLLARHLGQHHVGRGAGGRRVVLRDEEERKGEDDERQAPLEPAFVAPHPVEHGHGQDPRTSHRSKVARRFPNIRRRAAGSMRAAAAASWRLREPPKYTETREFRRQPLWYSRVPKSMPERASFRP
jgi:hypothetical protein